MYSSIIKPFFDYTAALVIMALIFPILGVIAICLAISYQGNPFFLQLRPGKNGKLFKIIKFKTMTDARDKEGNLLPDQDRITKIGQWVRKMSLDELLQILNILKGDMSWIGPRPLLPQYLPLYNAVQQQRHLVKPGITGWAQVNGRNTISWTKKFELDVWYVTHQSLILDLKILALTIKKVLVREGISQDGQATIEAFNGNN